MERADAVGMLTGPPWRLVPRIEVAAGPHNLKAARDGGKVAVTSPPSGFAGTSLRALTDAAGVNVASVNYHFGSKEGLLRAVVRRAMASVNADRQHMLDKLQARAGEPTAQDLVRAFVTTGATLRERHGDRAGHVAHFIGRVMCDPEPDVRRLFATEVGPVEGRYADALTKALPHLTADEVAHRYRAMVGLLALHQSGTLQDLHPSGHAGNATAEQLVTMLTGLFFAPSESDARAAQQSMTPRT